MNRNFHLDFLRIEDAIKTGQRQRPAIPSRSELSGASIDFGVNLQGAHPSLGPVLR